MKAKMSGQKEVKSCTGDDLEPGSTLYDEEAKVFHFLSSNCKQFSFHEH